MEDHPSTMGDLPPCGLSSIRRLVFYHPLTQYITYDRFVLNRLDVDGLEGDSNDDDLNIGEHSIQFVIGLNGFGSSLCFHRGR